MTPAASDHHPTLRLIADDLTGALDSATEFAALCGPVRVLWGRPAGNAAGALAYDIATREGSAEAAAAAAGEAARQLGLAEADIAYFKVDSLLRGHAGTELAACLRATSFDRVIIAPAFPFQKRRTVAGRQQSLRDGQWTTVGEDMAATLGQLGHAVTRCRPGGSVPRGISLWDCASDADLAAVVEAGRRAGGRVLWCGSGGLAAALAGTRQTDFALPLSQPVLGLFGTDHPVTQRQIAEAGPWVITLADGGAAAAETVRRQLSEEGAAIVRFALPPATPRAEAARTIATRLDELASRLEPPGTLVCGGGETLRALCSALGAEALEVTGRLMPGVPVSRFCGGRWHGVAVISKSGAFGKPDFLAGLLPSVPVRAAAEPRSQAPQATEGHP